MNQLYEKKCDCQSYDDEHRSSLIKMELPEYEESPHLRILSHGISSTIRFFFQLLLLVLFGYCLWRIHEIEVALDASDRFTNITRLIEKNNLEHMRHVRSANYFNPNGLGTDEKELPRGRMFNGKNESPKKPMNKDEFVLLMNALFDKIQYMHNDTDRSHFDNNMKAVFRAWTPVFDALLPRDMMADREGGRVTRSADKSSEELGKKKNFKKYLKSDKKSSEESSEEKKPVRVFRSIKQSSEESHEINDRSSQKNAAEQNSEEENVIDDSIEVAVSKIDDIIQRENEESSEEEHDRKYR